MQRELWILSTDQPDHQSQVWYWVAHTQARSGRGKRLGSSSHLTPLYCMNRLRMRTGSDKLQRKKWMHTVPSLLSNSNRVQFCTSYTFQEDLLVLHQLSVLAYVILWCHPHSQRTWWTNERMCLPLAHHIDSQRTHCSLLQILPWMSIWRRSKIH